MYLQERINDVVQPNRDALLCVQYGKFSNDGGRDDVQSTALVDVNDHLSGYLVDVGRHFLKSASMKPGLFSSDILSSS